MKNTYSLLPFISRSSFNLTLACSDVLAHFDCVTEALKEIRSDIKITLYQHAAVIFAGRSLARYPLLYLYQN